MKRRMVLLVVLATLSSSLFAVSAWGEGTFVSYISGWYTGHDSREWWDGNLDGQSTYVRFRLCRRAGGFATNADISVRRVIDTWPDDWKGTKRLYCADVDTAYWGDLQRGDYRFRLERIAGSTSGYQLWVDSLRVAW